MYFQKLYTDIFDKRGDQRGDVSMLREVVHEHPYFSLAHFYLLKHAIENGDDISNIAPKTALHFNNPFLLNEQLHIAPVDNNGFDNTTIGLEDEIKNKDAEILREEEILPEVAELRDEETVPVVEEKDEEKLPSPSSVNIDEAALVEDGVNETQTLPAEDEETHTDKAATAAPTEALYKDETRGILSTPGNEDNQAAAGEAVPVASAPSDAQGPNGTGEKVNEAPLFEPLSASDYFASQGIKLSEEQIPSDRMGKQLKSFTEWLKTMKKVHEQKTATADGPVDMTVQSLAEKSNKEEEVITEVMAEVYFQQGKTNRAKEIYEKLSLLNPSKSAYFAAKLEQIK